VEGAFGTAPQEDIALNAPQQVGVGLKLGFVVWLLAVALGLGVLVDYESGPGSAGTVPTTWPVESSFARDDATQTLILVAHPRCPCTRASVRELARALAHAPDAARVHALLLLPGDRDEEWARGGAIYPLLAELPGVEVHFDRGGAQARRFGAQTSGHVLLYDRRGRLSFSGGVTASRGHEGDSRGGRALRRLLEGDQSALHVAPVFGCQLFAEESGVAPLTSGTSSEERT